MNKKIIKQVENFVRNKLPKWFIDEQARERAIKLLKLMDKVKE